MEEGTLVLEVGGVYRAEDGFLWEIVHESKEGFIGLRSNSSPPWYGASLFYPNGVSVRQRTKNLVSKLAPVIFEVGEGIGLETPAPKKEHPPLTLEVGELYEDNRGEFWTVRSDMNGSFRVEDNFGHVRYHRKDGTFCNYGGISAEKSYNIRADLVRKIEPKRVEPETPAPKKSIAEELRETAEKHQTTEAVVQRLIDRAKEAADLGEIQIEIESSAFYNERLKAELAKHGFRVTGLFKQASYSTSVSWLDSVYLSWGETDSKAGVK
jgi:RimJ/RimL family protein N-acetyltransferase